MIGCFNINQYVIKHVFQTTTLYETAGYQGIFFDIPSSTSPTTSSPTGNHATDLSVNYIILIGSVIGGVVLLTVICFLCIGLM